MQLLLNECCHLVSAHNCSSLQLRKEANSHQAEAVTSLLCAAQSSEMHRGEDLACKLFVSVVIAINQSVLNATSFNSLTLCCQISIILFSSLSVCVS